MRSPLPITSILLFFPLMAHAGTIDLVCTDKTGFSINFEIDTSRNIVLTSGEPARDVSIDKGAITFVIDLESGGWLHIINRRTGNMTVQAPDKRHFSNFTCEQKKQKF